MRHLNSITPCDGRVKSTCNRINPHCAECDIRPEAYNISLGYLTKRLFSHVLYSAGESTYTPTFFPPPVIPFMNHESLSHVMTTYTLSRASPTNTILSDSQGAAAYVISTPFRLGGTQTTITQGNQVIATIQWNVFKKDTVTMNDRTSTVKEAFPRIKLLSPARTYTTLSGERFKWKGTNKLSCVSVETRGTLAIYERAIFSRVRKKPHVLNISPNADYLVEVLIVTWVIAEKKARSRRRTGGIGSVSSGIRRGVVNGVVRNA
ncbi:unnamed protein product [Rhizoctonia solani]|uniref:DUF6593 domain-containing protein n=1 Tax=Rhizoctonia solani TaxID=456999 RepID=A0A8H3AET9_9AGAM|nr:unnamed protein product [Rhizoctonia solani]